MGRRQISANTVQMVLQPKHMLLSAPPFIPGMAGITYSLSFEDERGDFFFPPIFINPGAM